MVKEVFKLSFCFVFDFQIANYDYFTETITPVI